MNYKECCSIFSDFRMERYKNAVGEDKAAELYLSLSRELFHVVSIFEIVLRNKIDICLQQAFKDRNWLYNSIQPQTNPALKYQGCFLRNGTKESAELIKVALSKIQNNSGGKFDHNQLVAGLGFGFWRYLFAGGKDAQFDATGKVLMKVFPKKPKSTPSVQYNQKWIFRELSNINNFRNRLAHHEPICFKGAIKDTNYARNIHQSIFELLNYMDVDTASVFSHFSDQVIAVCDEIDKL